MSVGCARLPDLHELISGDVQQAARILFKAKLTRMTEEEVEAVVVAHQDNRMNRVPIDLTRADPPVPANLTGSAQYSTEAKAALTIIGGIALDRFQSINPA